MCSVHTSRSHQESVAKVWFGSPGSREDRSSSTTVEATSMDCMIETRDFKLIRLQTMITTHGHVCTSLFVCVVESPTLLIRSTTFAAHQSRMAVECEANAASVNEVF